MTKPLRSQPTRDRILAEARRLFAEQGYERTTIRAVGAAAEVNPSMVVRYYGSKEDLFATAATIDFRMPDLAAVPREQRGEALIRHVMERWEAGDELPALLRAAATHQAAQRRLAGVIEQQASPAIMRVLPKDRSQTRLAMIVIQIAGLVLSRYVLEHSPVATLDRAELIQVVGAAVQSHLQ
ncbi:MAG: TetR family transcriptional regulator [Chloroflexota bacterium]